MKTTVSFICVLYNHSTQLVQRCIDSIHIVMKDVNWIQYDIILVNNNCWIDYQLKGDFKLLTSQINIGYCGGNNFGIYHSKSDYIVIINPDIKLLNSSGIERMIDSCKTTDSISGRLVGGQKWYAYPSSFPTNRKYVNNDLPFYIWEQTLDKPGNWKAFKYIDGSLIAFSKYLWKQVGGFDTDFFPGYFSENAFAFKAFLLRGRFMLQDCDIENTYLHDENDARLDMSVIEPLTKNMRLLFYYKYALNNWDLFISYLNH
jgi:GT2 family glycosyltransferase